MEYEDLKKDYGPPDFSNFRESERFLSAMEELLGRPRDIEKRVPPVLISPPGGFIRELQDWS